MKKSCHQPCKLAQILHHFLKANPKNNPPGDLFKTAAMWEGVKFFRPPPYTHEAAVQSYRMAKKSPKTYFTKK